MRNLFDLTGKKAVITGAAGLLGNQHARALLQINCEVELWDIDSDELERTKSKLESEFQNASIVVRKIDITSEADIITVVKGYVKDNTCIDILVNNAALNPKFRVNTQENDSHYENYSLELWNQEIAVGLTGAMLCSKHIGSHMASCGSGVILNIASDLSVISPDQRIYNVPGKEIHLQFKKPVSYSVIKTGILGLTRFLSTYWADMGVRANSLSPGGVFENQDPEFVQMLSSRIPMARMATPDEYIGAVQFLCSNASAYMNGHNLVMDGGRSIW